MTTSSTTLPHESRSRLLAGTAGRSILYCAVLIPVALGAVVAALAGRPETATRWWSRLRTALRRAPAGPATRPPRALAVAGHATLSLMLGVTALIPLSIFVVFVARGVFYGLVDHGPYDTSWGGPTRTGAWLVHFLVGIPLLGAAVLALLGIAALHQRLTAALTGTRPATRLIVLALAIQVPAVALFIAWLHQI
jgi:hypothetical protein